MLKSQKAEIIAVLEEEIRSSSALIVADYRGLSVGAITSVRTGLRPLDATFRVSKNTLARIAAERAGNDGLADMLTGPTAIAFCKGDPAAVAKKLSDLARETRILRLKGAVVEGQTLDEDGVKRLATLPSREVAERAGRRRARSAAADVRDAARRRTARVRRRARPDHPEEAGGSRVGTAPEGATPWHLMLRRSSASCPT